MPDTRTGTALLDTARAFRHRIIAQRDRVEASRRLPEDLARELAEAGLLLLLLRLHRPALPDRAGLSDSAFSSRDSRPRERWRWAIVRTACGQTNSAAVRLFGRLIPLIGRQIPLFVSVAEFALDPNGIKHLQGRVWPAKGRNQRFLLFFLVEQGNPLWV